MQPVLQKKELTEVGFSWQLIYLQNFIEFRQKCKGCLRNGPRNFKRSKELYKLA